MTVFEALVDRLGLPASGIHATAQAPNKCLWSCAWAVNPATRRDKGLYMPDDILPVENLSTEQALAELADISAWPTYPARVETGRITSEAAAWAVLLAGDANWLPEVRRFLQSVREYAIPGRTFVLPGESLPGWRGAGVPRPGWE